MVGGFNNNFRYRGVLFHVQTEANGASNSHVITHLFHGGNILASEKLDYSDKLDLGEDELDQVVRELLEKQHQAMIQCLQRGSHDRVILERLGAGVFSEVPAPQQSKTEVTAATRRTTRPAPPADSPAREPMRTFGDSPVSQKPLDEVVLEHLVENARKRKRKNR